MLDPQTFSILKFLLRTAFLVVVALFVLFRYIEARILFYPTRALEVFPDQAGLKFREVFFEADDKVKLNGWFVPSDGARHTVLFCHGNAGNISHRLEKIRFFNELGLNVFIFDYRGYGQSQGKPSEKGLYKDIEAAYGYLRSQGIADDQIIGYGESLGGAVIVELAFRKTMKALILDSTFASIKEMVRNFNPLLPSWVLSSRFDSEAKIRSIRIPKLIIHSLNDEIIPYAQGKKLYAAAGEPKTFLQIRGAHNSNFFESELLLRKGIGDFMAMIRGNR
jgi:fermentation-respiration switch protein FrsA (DUF1100 family)